MGGGESDVAHLKVTDTTANPYYYSPTYTDWNTTNTVWYYGPTTIYKYQVRCPERGCKTFNWLELDKITPCTNCDKKLKAVSDVPDHTIAVK